MANSKLQAWLKLIPIKPEELHVGFWVKVATLPIMFCTLCLCLTLDTPVTSEIQKTIIYVVLCIYFFILAISLILGVMGVYRKHSDSVFLFIALLGALLFTLISTYTFINLVIYGSVFAAGAPLVTGACVLISVLLTVSVFLPKPMPQLSGKEASGALEAEVPSTSNKEEKQKLKEKTPKVKKDKLKGKENKPKAEEDKPKENEEESKAKEDKPKPKEEKPKPKEEKPKTKEAKPKPKEKKDSSVHFGGSELAAPVEEHT